MSNKPTDVMYALATRIGKLERRVDELEKQMTPRADPPKPKPKRGRPPKIDPPWFANDE